MRRPAALGAPTAILINAGLGSADAYLSSRGQGEDLASSAHAAVLEALPSGLVPLAGRYGVAPGIITNLAATYAVGKVQGLSEREIERNMLQTLVQEGAFQSRQAQIRARSGNAHRRCQKHRRAHTKNIRE
ncbi:MAG: hypothetical protein WKF84_08495 [Pyrinomonadaceae bacterium]